MQKRNEIANKLSGLGSTQNVGRPTFAQNDQLLHTIQEISLLGCGADDRRRTEAMRSIRTLDGLTQELKKHGFTLSRTGVYLRFLPSRHNTTQGKCHVTTVPVKYAEPETIREAKILIVFSLQSQWSMLKNSPLFLDQP